MAKLLIVGGSGRTGRHLLEQAAQRGHTVRALVRKPEAGGARPGTLKVTRAEVAAFCLDCVDKNAWSRRAPIIWNGKE